MLLLAIPRGIIVLTLSIGTNSYFSLSKVVLRRITQKMAFVHSGYDAYEKHESRYSRESRELNGDPVSGD